MHACMHACMPKSEQRWAPTMYRCGTREAECREIRRPLGVNQASEILALLLLSSSLDPPELTRGGVIIFPPIFLPPGAPFSDLFWRRFFNVPQGPPNDAFWLPKRCPNGTNLDPQSVQFPKLRKHRFRRPLTHFGRVEGLRFVPTLHTF